MANSSINHLGWQHAVALQAKHLVITHGSRTLTRNLEVTSYTPTFSLALMNERVSRSVRDLLQYRYFTFNASAVGPASRLSEVNT